MSKQYQKNRLELAERMVAVREREVRLEETRRLPRQSACATKA